MTSATHHPSHTLIFSHANSFPASTYQVLFAMLEKQGYCIRALEKFGHQPRYPVTNNWPYLVQQLADFAAVQIEQVGEPAYLVGHSLGGILSIMTACLYPQLGGHGIKGVLLLDSPLIGGWRAMALQWAKKTQLVGALSPGKISRRRRNVWASEEEALAYFQHKKIFARWHPQVLRDYVAHGTHNETTPIGVQRVLSFTREVETTIYNTLPHHLNHLLRRHPPRCPVAFIGGHQSEEMQMAGMKLTHKFVQDRFTLIEGTHLFPMENPEATAQAMVQTLQKIG